MGSFRRPGSSVGLFRHEDESFSPYFNEFVTIYPGRYRVRTSLWASSGTRGRCSRPAAPRRPGSRSCSSPATAAAAQHPSYVLGYYDAPSLDAEGARVRRPG